MGCLSVSISMWLISRMISTVDVSWPPAPLCIKDTTCGSVYKWVWVDTYPYMREGVVDFVIVIPVRSVTKKGADL